MTPLWLAFLDIDPGGAHVTAVTDIAGAPAGVLCAWQTDDRPHEWALQADPRVYDAAGPECLVCLALAPASARPMADDPAVVEVRRAVLRDGRAAAVTMLTDDPVHIAGALTVARADRPDQVAALRDDPFASLWDARLLRVPAGTLSGALRPTGPSLERYGGRPWPYDYFLTVTSCSSRSIDVRSE